MTDAQLAADIAAAAGRIALAIRESGLLSGAALGAAGDRLADDFILRALAVHRPHDGLLSEETADTPDRLGKERVWIVDPLDGTREYAEGRADWAVHVALSIAGAPAAGAVALPSRGIVLRSDAPPAPAPRPEKLRVVVSRTRPPQIALKVAAALGAELVPMGSAGAKAAAVMLGEAELYLHAGGQHEWDNCAPVAVALAAGFVAVRLDGNAIAYNRADARVDDLLIAHPAVADAALAALASQL
jgi:3'(2'), 5'-bisphosphate nucleotidase